MTTVMIVGASRGIGLEFVRQYLADGCRVHATTRTLDEPGILGTLRGDIVLHRLEVRSREQIKTLVTDMKDESVDVFIHNAAVGGNMGIGTEEILQTNVVAPIRVAEAFIPVILRSREKKLVLISSVFGSREYQKRMKRQGPYPHSKAALNDSFRFLAPGWKQRRIISILLSPGGVATDMNPHGENTPTISVTGMRKVIAGLTNEKQGRFWNWNGDEVPW